MTTTTPETTTTDTRAVRIRVEIDPGWQEEGSNGHPLPEPEEHYQTAPYNRPDGSPMPYAEYLRTYGDPNRYTRYFVSKETQCGCCGSWIRGDGIGTSLYEEWIPEGTYAVEDPKLGSLAEVVSQLEG